MIKKVLFTGAAFILFAPHAGAGILSSPTDPCTFFSSGDCGPGNALVVSIPYIISFLFAFAAGASVLFVVVGASLMLIGMGEEGQVSKGKTAVIYALIGLAITMIAKSVVAFFIYKFNILVASADPIFDFMGIAVTAMVNVFTAVFVLIIMYAGFRMAFARGSTEEFNKAKNMLVWGIVAAVVINVAHALVNAVMQIPFTVP